MKASWYQKWFVCLKQPDCFLLYVLCTLVFSARKACSAAAGSPTKEMSKVLLYFEVWLQGLTSWSVHVVFDQFRHDERVVKQFSYTESQSGTYLCFLRSNQSLSAPPSSEHVCPSFSSESFARAAKCTLQESVDLGLP